MSKQLAFITFILWLIALSTWQILFHHHSILSELLWEIHTIFTSVIIFFLVLSSFAPETTLTLFKITFRIVFKVWLIIFIAFAMQNTFNQRGFALTCTFIFGYLEGMIDMISWLRNHKFSESSVLGKWTKTKKDKALLSVITVTVVHIASAFLSLIFFNIE